MHSQRTAKLIFLKIREDVVCILISGNAQEPSFSFKIALSSLYWLPESVLEDSEYMRTGFGA